MISTTYEISVAPFFACGAAFGDKHDHPDKVSEPIVLVLDGDALLSRGYFLTQLSDDVWGESECDWESEIACWTDIEPLSDFLVAVEPVPAQLYRDFRGLDDCEAFFPPWYRLRLRSAA